MERSEGKERVEGVEGVEGRRECVEGGRGGRGKWVGGGRRGGGERVTIAQKICVTLNWPCRSYQVFNYTVNHV